mmetsp:Transcript_31166/g.67057  ORF Transcript_31166/g.67057 Transcript_31166/m.67057 type:complete len:305 (-) Transcript_31166:3378-4292(-)
MHDIFVPIRQSSLDWFVLPTAICGHPRTSTLPQTLSEPADVDALALENLDAESVWNVVLPLSEIVHVLQVLAQSVVFHEGLEEGLEVVRIDMFDGLLREGPVLRISRPVRPILEAVVQSFLELRIADGSWFEQDASALALADLVEHAEVEAASVAVGHDGLRPTTLPACEGVLVLRLQLFCDIWMTADLVADELRVHGDRVVDGPREEEGRFVRRVGRWRSLGVVQVALEGRGLQEADLVELLAEVSLFLRGVSVADEALRIECCLEVRRWTLHSEAHATFESGFFHRRLHRHRRPLLRDLRPR